MAITPLPTIPSRQQPEATFATNGDNFLGALPTFVTEANALAADVNAKQTTASAAAATATTKAGEALASANAAAASASEASGYADAADTSAGQAAGSAADAADKYDQFDDRYLGSKAVDPSTDNDGGPLMEGALYWNSSAKEMKTWNGSGWVAAYLPASGYVTLNGTETLTNKTINTANNTLIGIKSVNGESLIGTGDVEFPPSVNVSNPGTIYITQQKTLTITNYDGFSTYSVDALSGTASITGDTITYTAPSSAGTDTLTVTVNGTGRDITLTINPASITAPTITSPTESAEIAPTNVTIVTSAFAPIGMADTHVKSQYVIKQGATTVYDSGESTRLTSITIADPGLERGTAYTIEARHKGLTLGWSAWSAARSITALNMGRGARIDGKATVIGNADGTPFTINGQQVWIAVLDAAYRGVSVKFGTYGYDSTLPNVTSSLGTMTQGESEATMDARAAAETGASTGNCDVWMTRNTTTDSQSIVGVPAVAMCRAISLDGTPCDLPTAKVLMRIWQHRTFIDDNDPTAAANTAKKLSAWGFGSASGTGVWSSSEYNSNNAVYVTSNGNVHYYDKNRQFGVVPAMEIPA